MNLETTEFKRTVEISSINESTAARTWSTGHRTSRADAAMVGVLCVDSVDAVFEEESLSFVESVAELHETVPSRTEPATIVESLATQLAVLESQCVNLRRMLEMAANGD
jgi:hypothetical protein